MRLQNSLPRIFIEAPPTLVADLRFFRQFGQIAEAMGAIAEQSDDLLRNLAFDACRDLAEQFAGLAAGRITFLASDAWRTVYEEVLRGPGVSDYRSIAVVDSEEYWANEPGRRSMKLNYRLIHQKPLSIRRICIVADELWPDGKTLPEGRFGKWLDEQARHGIDLHLVRRSQLSGEPDLGVDLGIYGIRAVGYYEPPSTVSGARYTLSFNMADHEQAEEKWERLRKLFAVPFRDLVGTDG